MMAVKLVSPRAKAYQGLSTDDKPAAPPEGSTFLAVDTGEEWLFYDEMWVLRLGTDMLAFRLVSTAV